MYEFLWTPPESLSLPYLVVYIFPVINLRSEQNSKVEVFLEMAETMTQPEESSDESVLKLEQSF